jgi:hypothetical protein
VEREEGMIRDGRHSALLLGSLGWREGGWEREAWLVMGTATGFFGDV